MQICNAQVDDLHRHFIDHLTIPSREGRGVLRRDDAVFDCWFESGSMPYAQNHYPFENKEFFLVRSSSASPPLRCASVDAKRHSQERLFFRFLQILQRHAAVKCVLLKRF